MIFPPLINDFKLPKSESIYKFWGKINLYCPLSLSFWLLEILKDKAMDDKLIYIPKITTWIHKLFVVKFKNANTSNQHFKAKTLCTRIILPIYVTFSDPDVIKFRQQKYKKNESFRQKLYYLVLGKWLLNFEILIGWFEN